MKGQLSAEMLILIVVVFAIVAIAALQLISTAKDTGENIQNQSERLNRLTSEAMKSPLGGYCIDSEDCQEGYTCDGNRCG